MIELNKRDLEVIARQRFQSRLWRRALVFIVILVAAVVMMAIFVPDAAADWLKVVTIGSLCIYYIAGAVWWVRAENKAVKAFTAQCEADPELRYKADQGDQ